MFQYDEHCELLQKQNPTMFTWKIYDLFYTLWWKKKHFFILKAFQSPLTQVKMLWKSWIRWLEQIGTTDAHPKILLPNTKLWCSRWNADLHGGRLVIQFKFHLKICEELIFSRNANDKFNWTNTETKRKHRKKITILWIFANRIESNRMQKFLFEMRRFDLTTIIPVTWQLVTFCIFVCPFFKWCSDNLINCFCPTFISTGMLWQSERIDWR